MKNIFTLVFISLIQIVLGQNTTTPTGSSTEVGETAGQLSVSLSGAATYNIPIEVPPGLNGVVPQLSLNYSSQSGNGVAGYGWNIGGLSAITRIPSTKFHDGTDDPVDFDALDRFALDGQRLIVKAGTTGVYGANNTVYETENFSNVKITSFGVHPGGANYGPAWFKVEYPDGSVAEYGNGSISPVRNVTTWAINIWKNPQNIAVEYFYQIFGNTIYPYSVQYGSTQGNSLNQIIFNIRNRERIEQYYIAGVSIENTNILFRIDITGGKTYLLEHEMTPLKYQKLKSITEKINDGSNKILNPTVFEYGDSIDPTELVSSSNITTNQNINTTNTEKAVVGDFDGDGNSDYIFIKKATNWPPTPTPTYSYSLFKNNESTGIVQTSTNYITDIFPTTFLTGNTTNGFKMHPFEGWTVLSHSTTGGSLVNNQIITLNLNTYSLDTNTNSIVLQQTKQFVPPNQLCTIKQQLNGFYDKPPLLKNLQGDFNGDGITDMIVILAGQNHSVCDVYNPTTFNSTRRINEVFFIDLKKDITANYVTSFGLIPLTKFGISTLPLGISTLPLNDPITKDSDIEVIDFNGDGQSDIMIFDYKRVRVFTLNNTNNTLTLLTTFSTHFFNYVGTNLFLSQDISVRYLGDFNGDGKADIAYQLAMTNFDKWIFLISNGLNFVPIQSSVGLNYEPPTKTIYFETYSDFCGACTTQEIDRKIWDIQISKLVVKDFNNDGKTDILFEKNIIHDYTFKRDRLTCPNYYTGIPNWPSTCPIPNGTPYFSAGTYLSDWYVDYTNQGRKLSQETKLLLNTLNTSTSIGFTPKTTLINYTDDSSVNLNLNLNFIEVNSNITKNNKFNLNTTSISGTNISSFALARNIKTTCC